MPRAVSGGSTGCLTSKMFPDNSFNTLVINERSQAIIKGWGMFLTDETANLDKTHHICAMLFQIKLAAHFCHIILARIS